MSVSGSRVWVGAGENVQFRGFRGGIWEVFLGVFRGYLWDVVGDCGVEWEQWPVSSGNGSFWLFWGHFGAHSAFRLGFPLILGSFWAIFGVLGG